MRDPPVSGDGPHATNKQTAISHQRTVLHFCKAIKPTW
jgi:hypothetical protein